MHPWHDVSNGPGFPGTVTAVIEIPAGSSSKYKLDHATGLLRLDEFLSPVIRFPANYGFIPRTLENDGDALDVFVFTREAVPPLTLLSARILGGLTVRSKKKNLEEKLIAICPGDPELARVQSMRDLGRVLEKGTQPERTAAALALASSPDPAATGLLWAYPDLSIAVNENKVSWQSLANPV